VLSSAGAGPWGEAPSCGLIRPSPRSRKTATSCKSSFLQGRYLEFDHPRLAGHLEWEAVSANGDRVAA
jgi:hypothetical protein